MPDIFLCHSSQDEEIASDLVLRLRQEGYSVWYAPDDLLVGHSLVDSVFDGIRNSHAFVLLLTRHAVNSRWVQRELKAALVQELAVTNTLILVLRLDDTKQSSLISSLDQINCRVGFGPALEGLASRFADMGLFKYHHGSQVEVEDLVEREEAAVWQLVDQTMALESRGDRFIHGTEYTAENFADIRSKTERCLNLIDHLCSIENSTEVVCAYCETGNNLAILISDYSRQVQYMEMLSKLTVPCIDNLILRAIANACAGFAGRSEASLREALLLYAQQVDKFNAMAITRFIFRVTRHVRFAFTCEYVLAVGFVLKERDDRVDRLVGTLAALDVAVTSALDFDNGYHNLLYGSALWNVGLTKHATSFLERAVELGESEDRVYPESTLKLRQQLSAKASCAEGNITYSLSSLQASNFSFQMGNFIDPAFDNLLKNDNPDLYAEIVRDDKLFGTGFEV